MKVVPPNFGYVEDGIFRCGLPSPRHYGFLSSLQLRTCVLLTDTPDPTFCRWLLENNIYMLCPLMLTGSSYNGSSMEMGSANVSPVPPYMAGHAGPSASPLVLLHPAALPQRHHLHTSSHLLPAGAPPIVATVGMPGGGYSFSSVPIAPGPYLGPMIPSASSALMTGGPMVESTTGGASSSPSTSPFSSVGVRPGNHEQEEAEEETSFQFATSSTAILLSPVLPSSVSSSLPGGTSNRNIVSQSFMDAASGGNSPGNHGGTEGGRSAASLPLANAATGMKNVQPIPPVSSAGTPPLLSSSPSPSASSTSTFVGDTSSNESHSRGTAELAGGQGRIALEEGVGVSATLSSQNPINNNSFSGNNTSGSATLNTFSNSSGAGFSPASTLTISQPLLLGHPSLLSSSPHHHPPFHYPHHPRVEYYYGDQRATWIKRRREKGVNDGAWDGMSGDLEGGEGGGDSMRSLTGLMTLSESVVVRILEVLLDRVHYPLLITCSKGRYRTGIVCACLRKMQRWNLVSILEEYRRFAGDKSRAENEEFIELFDTDLVSTGTKSGLEPSILY